MLQRANFLRSPSLGRITSNVRIRDFLPVPLWLRSIFYEPFASRTRDRSPSSLRKRRRTCFIIKRASFAKYKRVHTCKCVRTLANRRALVLRRVEHYVGRTIKYITHYYRKSRTPLRGLVTSVRAHTYIAQKQRYFCTARDTPVFSVGFYSSQYIFFRRFSTYIL